MIVTGKDQNRTERSVSNAEISRALTALKRIFTLAVQAGKILHRPHIALLRENNVRTGFCEREQFEIVRKHLPAPIRPVVTLAYVTGWCIASEVLPLQWRQVDFKSGEVRLDAGTTKNQEGRVFKMTDDLRLLLEAQRLEAEALRQKGLITAHVFVRMVAQGLGGRSRRHRFAHSQRLGHRVR